MPETLDLIPAADDRGWTRWLEPVAHDFYHTAAYHRFSAESGEGEAFLAVYGSGGRYLAWPYLLRPIEQAPGWRDVTSVYGYAGPLLAGPPEESFLARAHEACAGLWRSQRAVSAFTRLHPLLENHRWSRPDGLAPGGETVSIDLAASAAYPSGLRKDIGRARRRGLVTEIDPAWRGLEEFVGLYHDTMTRNHAAPFYFFPLSTFRRLQQALGAHAFLALTRCGDRLAAAGLVIEYHGIVHDHLCATSREYLHLGPSKVLLDDVRGWGAAQGHRVFHLGGGRTAARDGLFRFKARFSPRRHAFHTGRWVLDRKRYDELAAGRPSGDYFPAYRSPHDRHAAFAVAR